MMTLIDLDLPSVRRPASLPQRSADAPDAKLLPLLSAISKSTRQLASLRLAEIGVIVGQDQLIDYLDPVQPRSGQDAALALSVRPSTISKMLDRLEHRAWITRAQDHGDMRRTLILLTETGAEVRTKVRRVWDALERELAQALGHELAGPCLSELERVHQALSRRLSRLR